MAPSDRRHGPVAHPRPDGNVARWKAEGDGLRNRPFVLVGGLAHLPSRALNPAQHLRTDTLARGTLTARLRGGDRGHLVAGVQGGAGGVSLALDAIA